MFNDHDHDNDNDNENAYTYTTNNCVDQNSENTIWNCSISISI